MSISHLQTTRVTCQGGHLPAPLAWPQVSSSSLNYMLVVPCHSPTRKAELIENMAPSKG